jgi:hypothetical protein
MPVALSGMTREQRAWRKDGLPSRSSFRGEQARLRVASRRSGAASFAGNHERRMVDQNIASWNPLVLWLRRVDSLRRVA